MEEKQEVTVQLSRKLGYMWSSATCSILETWIQVGVRHLQCVVMTLRLWPPLRVTSVRETARPLVLFLAAGIAECDKDCR